MARPECSQLVEMGVCMPACGKNQESISGAYTVHPWLSDNLGQTKQFPVQTSEFVHISEEVSNQ